MAHPSLPSNHGKSTKFETDETISRAIWDFDNTKILLELVRDEKLAGNFGGKRTLNSMGLENVIQNLFARTGTKYDIKQIKNKFECLQRDFENWLDLTKNETALGWNYITITEATDEWWNRKIAQDSSNARFREHGLDHSELMYEIFSDLTGTGQYHWTPSSVYFLERIAATEQAEKQMYASSSDDDQKTTRTQEVNSLMRGSGLQTHCCSGGHRQSCSDRMRYEEWSNRLDNVTKEFMNSESTERRHHHTIETPPDLEFESVQRCMVVLNQVEGVDNGDDLYMAGIEAFEMKVKRNLWLCLKSDRSRLNLSFGRLQ